MGDLRNWKQLIINLFRSGYDWSTTLNWKILLKSNSTKSVDKIYVRTYATILNLQLCKVCDSYPRSIISLLGIVLKVTNLTKVQINDRFFENYENLFLTWPFKMILTASTSDFQSPTNLKSIQGRCIIYFWSIVESLRNMWTV